MEPQCPRVLLLTGNGLRHSFAARQLAARVDLVGVLTEKKPAVIENRGDLPPGDVSVIDRHFRARDIAEHDLLGTSMAWPDTAMKRVDRGEVNSSEVLDWISSLDPNVVMLYGTCIIKPPLLDAYDGRMINLHLGLSPYYRGSGTNFWPLVNGEPECVGATIHLATAKVDAGSILAQVRPNVAEGDSAHQLGTKTIVAALEELPVVIDRYVSSTLVPQVQDPTKGRIYRRRDFDANSVRTMWRNFENGMLGDYVRDHVARDQAYPIVELD